MNLDFLDRLWQKVPEAGRVFIGLLMLSLFVYFILSLYETPGQREIRECVGKLNDAADGGYSYFQLERICLKLQEDGKL